MKRGRRRTETNNGITGWCSWFHFLSLFWHLKNSFSKTRYLPFNQPPITKSKGFRDEAGDKTQISRFCPCFNVPTIENINWMSWGRRQKNPWTSSIASLMRSIVFYNIVTIKDNFLSHRSDPGAPAWIPRWSIDSIFFLSGSVSLRRVSLWKEARMKRTEASTEMTAKSCTPLYDS